MPDGAFGGAATASEPASSPLYRRRIVVEAAVAGAATTIVTLDLLDEADLVAWLTDGGISVVTPADLLEVLEGRRAGR